MIMGRKIDVTDGRWKNQSTPCRSMFIYYSSFSTHSSIQPLLYYLFIAQSNKKYPTNYLTKSSRECSIQPSHPVKIEKRDRKNIFVNSIYWKKIRKRERWTRCVEDLSAGRIWSSVGKSGNGIGADRSKCANESPYRELHISFCLVLTMLEARD